MYFTPSLAKEVFGGLNITNDGTKTTIMGETGDYTRIGDAGTTGHALASEDDLLCTGKLEVDGPISFDGALTCYNVANIVDDAYFTFGSGGATDACILWETADGNAHALLILAPAAAGNDVPVVVFGDVNARNVDLGFFNGITQPQVAVVDADRDSWITFGWEGDDFPAIKSNKNRFDFYLNDADDYFIFETTGNIPTIRAAGAYLRIGDAATTSRGLAAEDDLLVTGKLEVDGVTYFDGELHFASKIKATADGADIQASDSDGHFLQFLARDTGVGGIEVARLQGAAEPYFQATLGIVLNPINQVGTNTGRLIYNTGTNKLNFYAAAAWEVVTSSGFCWQSYENPTRYYDIYDAGRFDGKHPVQFIEDGLVMDQALGWSLLEYKWGKDDVAVMKVDHVGEDNVTHALPYPLEQAFRDSEYIETLENRIIDLENQLKEVVKLLQP